MINKKAEIHLRVLAFAVIAVFTAVVLCADVFRAQDVTAKELGLPAPSSLLAPGAEFSPVILRGLDIYPDDPYRFDFIIDQGQGKASKGEVKELINYFLAALSVPSRDLWVNLSPYEKDRVMDDDLVRTDLGQAMLGQDYILKQLSSSLTHPDTPVGRAYWCVENRDSKLEIREDLSKIWIKPDKAVICEEEDRAFITQSSLKIESDAGSPLHSALHNELNTGKHFAKVRQMYHSILLAVWFKNRLADHLINQIYTGSRKVKGIDSADPRIKEKIYGLYIKSFEKGVYDLSRPVSNLHSPLSEKNVKRVFSGGMDWEHTGYSSGPWDIEKNRSSLTGVPLKAAIRLKPVSSSLSVVDEVRALSVDLLELMGKNGIHSGGVDEMLEQLKKEGLFVYKDPKFIYFDFHEQDWCGDFRIYMNSHGVDPTAEITVIQKYFYMLENAYHHGGAAVVLARFDDAAKKVILAVIDEGRPGCGFKTDKNGKPLLLTDTDTLKKFRQTSDHKGKTGNGSALGTLYYGSSEMFIITHGHLWSKSAPDPVKIQGKENLNGTAVIIEIDIPWAVPFASSALIQPERLRQEYLSGSIQVQEFVDSMCELYDHESSEAKAGRFIGAGGTGMMDKFFAGDGDTEKRVASLIPAYLSRLPSVDEKIKKKAAETAYCLQSMFVENNWPLFRFSSMLNVCTTILLGRDPEERIKEKADKLGRLLFGELRSRDNMTFQDIFTLGALANACDFASKNIRSQDRALEDAREFVLSYQQPSQSWGKNDLADFERCLSDGSLKTVLFMVDNTGEADIDLFAVKYLMGMGHKVIIAAKSRPSFNDITVPEMKDLLSMAEEEGFFDGLDTARLQVVGTGTAGFGIDFSLATDEFDRAWQEADVIIAKGQANYLCMRDAKINRPCLYLSMVKKSVEYGYRYAKDQLVAEFVMPEVSSNAALKFDFWAEESVIARIEHMLGSLRNFFGIDVTLEELNSFFDSSFDIDKSSLELAGSNNSEVRLRKDNFFYKFVNAAGFVPDSQSGEPEFLQLNYHALLEIIFYIHVKKRGVYDEIERRHGLGMPVAVLPELKRFGIKDGAVVIEFEGPDNEYHSMYKTNEDGESGRIDPDFDEMSDRKKVKFSIAAANTMKIFHEKNILVIDFQPRNILFNSRESVMLIDFMPYAPGSRAVGYWENEDGNIVIVSAGNQDVVPKEFHHYEVSDLYCLAAVLRLLLGADHELSRLWEGVLVDAEDYENATEEELMKLREPNELGRFIDELTAYYFGYRVFWDPEIDQQQKNLILGQIWQKNIFELMAEELFDQEEQKTDIVMASVEPYLKSEEDGISYSGTYEISLLFAGGKETHFVYSITEADETIAFERLLPYQPLISSAIRIFKRKIEEFKKIKGNTMIIGITGKAASGKSSVVSGYLKELGYRVIESDDATRAFSRETNPELCETLRKVYGDGVVTPEGKIDRKYIFRSLKAGTDDYDKYVSIYRPHEAVYLLDEMLDMLKQKEHKVIFIDSSFVSELGFDDILDAVWYVQVPDEKRLEFMTERAAGKFTPEQMRSAFEALLPFGPQEEDYVRMSRGKIIRGAVPIEEMRSKIDEFLKNPALSPVISEGNVGGLDFAQVDEVVKNTLSSNVTFEFEGREIKSDKLAGFSFIILSLGPVDSF